MEGWWGKAVGGSVRLVRTTLNMIQNVSQPPACLPGHHNQTYQPHHTYQSPGVRMFHSLIFSSMLRIELICVSASGNARWKERKWRANRKYPDYRNKWENILCSDLSLVSPSRGDDTGICPPSSSLLDHTNTASLGNIYKWAITHLPPPPPPPSPPSPNIKGRSEYFKIKQFLCWDNWEIGHSWSRGTGGRCTNIK